MTDSRTTAGGAAGFRAASTSAPRLLARESRGRAGETWRAEADGGRTVMVKVCAVASAAARRRAAAEQARLADLASDRLVPVSAVHQVGTQLWVVRELAAGASLRRLRTVVTLSPGQVALVGLGVLAALADLHRAGLHHGGLHPDNVWVGADGGIRVMDAALPRRGPSPASGVRGADADLAAAGTLLLGLLDAGADPLPNVPATPAAAPRPRPGLLVTPGASHRGALVGVALSLSRRTGSARAGAGEGASAPTDAADALRAWREAAGPLASDALQAASRLELATFVARLRPRDRPFVGAGAAAAPSAAAASAAPAAPAAPAPPAAPSQPAPSPRAQSQPAPSPRAPSQPAPARPRAMGRGAAAAMGVALVAAAVGAVLVSGGLGHHPGSGSAPPAAVPQPPRPAATRHPAGPRRPVAAASAPATPGTPAGARPTPAPSRRTAAGTLPADLAPLPALGPGSAGAVQGVSVTTTPAGCTRSVAGCSVTIRIDLGAHPAEPIGWALDLVDACTGRVVAGPAGEYTAPAPYTWVEAEASVTPAAVAGTGPVPVAVVAVTTTPARAAAAPAYLVPPGATCAA